MLLSLVVFLALAFRNLSTIRSILESPSSKKLDQGEQKQKQPPPPSKITTTLIDIDSDIDLACSCWNSSATTINCCKRAFLATHKTGYAISNKLTSAFKEFYNNASNTFKMQQMKNHKKRRPTQTRNDERYVIMTRNIYQAIASGYLYHKKGKECHVAPNRDDRPWPAMANNLHYFWEYTTAITAPIDPPHNNRSLCVYLANETMVDGLKIYIDWVFNVYYDAIDEWMTEGKNNSNNSGSDGTAKATNRLHVCFDDITSPEHDLDVLDEIKDHFFPMGDVPNYTGKRTAGVTKKGVTEAYTGGHSTSHDPTLRAEIRKITEELDRKVFGGELAAFQKRYPCG